MPNNTTDNYQALFLKDTPLLDVRAPIEFEKGAFPGALNLPLLDNLQRQQIGKQYKDAGQDAAIALGWSLLTPEIKAQRLQQWSTFIDNNPHGYLYCFRGGLRSKITQQLIAETGRHYPRIHGGYKAMRQYLLQVLEHHSKLAEFIVVAGPACSGKTRLLNQINNSLDLEGIAQHKGSAFGGQITEQPSQIDFENALAVKLLRLCDDNETPIFVEDEGKLIGRCSLPLPLKRRLVDRPRIVLDCLLEQRIEIGMQDYVINRLKIFVHRFGELGHQYFCEHLQNSLLRIRKRLGGVNFQKISQDLHLANEALLQHRTTDNYLPVIKGLLTDYYDPMYRYQQQLHGGKVLYRGTMDALQKWCASTHSQ